MNEKIIEDKTCVERQQKLSVGSDMVHIDKETELCKADSIAEDQEIIIYQMKKPDDVVKLHKTLESIFE